MKTLTTLILALVVTGVMGQSKKPDVERLSLRVGQTFFYGIYKKPIMWVKPIRKVPFGQYRKLTLHVHKSQLHWLNDSTAIITKPKAK